ncbi:TetR/AcrR family transcriptional regulator C-terminal domain-containing protein [Nocardia aobensis]|uniref:TetR/AcrR family transcriptional regulator C-terminal domain-containing protein n=1 Tax=Nocardia aobensis TaxID=257277 RepID=UPI000315714B|nr:TetR/AcrR family transcriptional regulator C-terminal domain-containing protein [Nocardia aobensis]
MKLDANAIGAAALELLDETGLDGLTMRKVASALDVQAPALYWHVKNKQELLDVMARAVFAAAVDRVEGPRRGETWQDWIAELAGRLRSSMLRHRDGGRLLAGTYVSDESMWRTMELTLRTLEDAGFSADEAGWVFPIVLHYTVGFVIEEQARIGADYGADNPYSHIDRAVDRDRYPRTANLVTKLSAMDPNDEFDHGVRVILTGIRTLANIER